MLDPRTTGENNHQIPLHRDSMSHTRARTISSDNKRIRIYDETSITSEPLEISYAVKTRTLCAACVLGAAIVGAEVYLAIGVQDDPVYRYIVVPFGLWILLSFLSLIFRWQSRKLMMTGYLEFYRKSSKLWKTSYGLASSCYCLGTTFYVLTKDYLCDSYNPIVTVSDHTRATVLFVFWTITFLTLVFLYGYLLFDFLRHNRRRRLPDGVKPADYHPLPGGVSGAPGSPNLRGGGSKPATLRMQAVTIRYLEKQVATLSNQLIEAQNVGNYAGSTRSDSHRGLLDFPSGARAEIEVLTQEKQLMASEMDSLNAQLASKTQEVTGLQRQVNNLQAIRTRLESELATERDAVASKQEQVNELQILLAVEREAADQARVFFEEYQPPAGAKRGSGARKKER